jgi:SAM-dependent methyltransferase
MEYSMINRVLTNNDRKKYLPIINDMFDKVPDMMKRKIPEANVQQAYAVDTVRKFYKDGDSILCVGSYEDTAYEYLKLQGMDIFGIDPLINYDLKGYLKTTDKKYDIVMSVSVMEHVANDSDFIKDICSALKVGGIAILTVDFNNTWKAGKPKPSIDQRLYTEADYKRLASVMALDNCFLLDEITGDVPADFVFENASYSFASMVFRKFE